MSELMESARTSPLPTFTSSSSSSSTTRRRRQNTSQPSSSLSQSAVLSSTNIQPKTLQGTYVTNVPYNNSTFADNVAKVTKDHATDMSRYNTSSENNSVSHQQDKYSNRHFNGLQNEYPELILEGKRERHVLAGMSGSDTDDHNNNNNSNSSNNNNDNNPERRGSLVNNARRNRYKSTSVKVKVHNTSNRDGYGNDGDDDNAFVWRCRCSASILVAVAIWMVIIMTIFLVVGDSTKTREMHALNAETAYNASTMHHDRVEESIPSPMKINLSVEASQLSEQEQQQYQQQYQQQQQEEHLEKPMQREVHGHERAKYETPLEYDASQQHNRRNDDRHAPHTKTQSDEFDKEMKIHVCPAGSECRERVYVDHVRRNLLEEANLNDGTHPTEHNGNNVHPDNKREAVSSSYTDETHEVEEVLLPYSCKGRSCAENDVNGLQFGAEQGIHDGIAAFSNCNYHSCYSFYDNVINVHVHDNLLHIIKSAIASNEDDDDDDDDDDANLAITLNEPHPKRVSSGMKWQCVEYARRYWMLRGKPQPAYFESVYGAADIWTFTHVRLLDGTEVPLWKFANNGTILAPTTTATMTMMHNSSNHSSFQFTSNVPVKGDLLLWERNVTADIPHGHVAVIVEVDVPHQLVYVAEQNWDSARWPGPHFNYSRTLELLTNDKGEYVIKDDGLKIFGWVRYVVPV